MTTHVYNLSMQFSPLPTCLIFLLVLAILPTASAQGPTLTSLTPSSSTTRTSSSTSITRFRLTDLPTISLPTATTTSTPNPYIPGHPPTSGSSQRPTTEDPEEQQRASLVNLYFVFLLLLVLLAGGGVWWFYRRRKRRLLASRQGRRDALQRDLGADSGDHGTAGDWFGRNLSWAAAGRRRWLSPRGPAALRPEEDGLDESGEAPPAYEPGGGVALRRRLSDIAEASGKPPDYEEREVESTTVDGSTLRGSDEVGRSASGSGRSARSHAISDRDP